MSMTKCRSVELFFVLTLAVKHLVLPLVRLRLGEVNCLSNLNFHTYIVQEKRQKHKKKMMQLGSLLFS